MPEACDNARCPTCYYDISTTRADGFTRCPECGTDISGPVQIVLRDAPLCARLLVAVFSFAPVIWVPMLAGLAGWMLDLDFLGALALVWPASWIVVYAVNRRLEHWRNPIGAKDRACERTCIAVTLHIVIPICAVVIVFLFGACLL